MSIKNNRSPLDPTMTMLEARCSPLLSSKASSSVRRVTLLSHSDLMRRNGLSEYTLRCGKPSCSSGQHATPDHPPYFSVTGSLQGDMGAGLQAAGQAQLVPTQIRVAHNFRSQAEDYSEAYEQWADAQLRVLRRLRKRLGKNNAARAVPNANDATNRGLPRPAIRARSGF